MLAEQGTTTSVRLSARDCDVHELFAWDALNPLQGYHSRADLANVLANGRLTDGTPWRWPWRLTADAEVPEGGTVVLLEPEGQRLGTVQVEESWTDRGRHHLSGAVRLDGVPGTGAFGELRRPPGETTGRVGLVVDGPISPAAVLGALKEANGSPLLLMPFIGADGPGCAPSTVAAVRAVHAIKAWAKDEVEIAGVPLPASWWREPDQTWLAAKVARRFGVETLLVPEHAGVVPRDSTTAHVRRCPIARNSGGPQLSQSLDAVLSAARPSGDRAGLVVLLTGLPSAGKSTLARGLRDRLLISTTRTVTLLDGDIVRTTLSPDLSFSREDRLRNLSRLATVATECARHGGVVLCAPVAPHEEGRELFRSMVTGVANFLLVHVATPVQECRRRDPKGLYAASAAGRLHGLTGVDDPYEIPFDPDLVVGEHGESAHSAVSAVLDGLVSRGWLRPAAWELG